MAHSPNDTVASQGEPAARDPGCLPAPGHSETNVRAVFFLRANAGDTGIRLDRWLRGRLPDFSRVRLQALIRQGALKRTDPAPVCAVMDPNHRLKAGESFALAEPPPAPAALAPKAFPLSIQHEDRDVIVLEKPAGLSVHPGAGPPRITLVHGLLAHAGRSLSGIGGVMRPGIVHRLDRQTSGLMVVAKGDEAHRVLSAQFSAGKATGALVREYVALVWGRPSVMAGEISLPIGRSTRNRRLMTAGRPGGDAHCESARMRLKSALTRYRVVGCHDPAGAGAVSLMRLRLGTGRTHQVRVHMAALGHPVLADGLYGREFHARARGLPDPARTVLEAMGDRHALHACRLRFIHPRSGACMNFWSPLPTDLDSLCNTLHLVYHGGPLKAP